MDKVYKLRKVGTEEYYGKYELGPIEKSRSWARSQDAKKEIRYASGHDPIKARSFEIVEYKLVENGTAGYKEDWKFCKAPVTETKTKDMWDE